MRWFCETVGQAEDRLKPWHLWFAWRPVFIPEVGMVWLETIERSGHVNWSVTCGFDGFIYEYRIPK